MHELRGYSRSYFLRKKWSFIISLLMEEPGQNNEDDLILPYFTDQQKWIIQQRLDGVSYNAICHSWPFNNTRETTKVGANLKKKDDNSLFPQNIITCLKRSALGLKWNKGMQGGTDPYLCEDDLECLKDQICSAARDGSPLDTSAVISKAFETKKARYAKARDFLIAVHAEALLKDIDKKLESEKPPVRSWINGVIKDIDAALKTKHFIDILRLIASTPENIRNYFAIASEIIARYHPYLIFGADETMLFPSMKRKIVIPNNLKQEFIEAAITLPHFTAMCSHNLYGRSFAPFIILPNLKNLPEDLQEFVDRGDVTFASSKSGWQTKETFLYWVICFINSISEYRRDLKPDLLDQRALLIIDGHTSRENAFALQLLEAAKIDVLTIPAHTSHILQMFDVAIASVLKRVFSDKFNEGVRHLSSGNMAVQYRILAVSSFLTAWSAACTYTNCQAGAIATGTIPCDVEIPLASKFLAPLHPRYEARARSHLH